MRIPDSLNSLTSSLSSTTKSENSFAAHSLQTECEPTLFNEIILPEVPSFSEPRGIGSKLLNYVTGIPDFFSSLRAEACNNEITGSTGKLLLKAVAKTALFPVALGAGFGLGVLGGIAASGAGVLFGGALGAGLVLGVGPLVVDKIIDISGETLSRIGARWERFRS
ncbi:hypothetical protein EBR25_01645 [bacterium]|jgi:hypothetical protein|nr:hypothetical protein [bacterium]